jgi:phenylacetate-CoA ligase
MLVTEEDLVINALPYEVSHLGLLFHRILQDGVGAGVVPVGKGGFYSIPEKSLQIMRDLKGDHLFTTPAYAIHLAEKAQEVGYEIGKDLKPKSVWLAGESCSPGLRRRIEAMWKTNAYLCLSSLECGPIALECAEKDGMHLATGYVFVEIVPMDNRSLRVPDGTGEIVVTVLWRHSSPLIRYRTGLLGSVDLTPCACGFESPRIRFCGDKSEILELSKDKISQREVEDCLSTLPELSPWYYLKPHGGSLTILIPGGMSSEEKKELREKAEEKLREHFEIPLRVEVEEHSLKYKGEHWSRVLAS